MNPQLHADITRRLERDYEFKPYGEWLQQGRCPSCEKREMFARAEAPWVIRCGRANKCGAEYHVKEIYSDLFNSWSDRHPVTPKDPNAAADAYLRDARGFDLERIKGWYSQENYWDPKQQIGSATVRFTLSPTTYWERIIDRPERFGKRKATFKGEYAGTWWQAPGLDLASEEITEIWVVEGIFDNIALLHNEIPSVSTLSCNNYPEKALADLAKKCEEVGTKKPILIFAYDGDKAGRRYTRQWVDKARESGWVCRAATIPLNGKAKLDWNDMHQRGRLTAKDREEYLYHGALLIAATAHDKALLIYNRKGFNTFHFGFDNRLYWFEVDLERYGKAREELSKAYPELSDMELRDKAMLEAHTLQEIANCYPSALYYQANLITDESWYYLRVDFPHDGPAIKNTFTGAQLSSSSEFKKRLLAMAPGAVFTGSSKHLDRMMKDQLYNIKTVQTIDFVGYSRDHSAYVFSDFAIKDGRTYELNEEDFFDIGKLSIKTLNQSATLAINRDLNAFKADWINLLWRCYGPKGFVALAFWLGALFAEQIRTEHKSYPFIEIIGDPGAGKSTLIEFLWKLLGRRDYEGFDPSKSTMAARARNFAQVSNMPVVLIEGDRGEEDKAHAKGFDWDELKTAYNGRSVRSRGVKNGGNETYEPPFRGAIVISQNAAVSASDAVLQRIVHIHCSVADHTPASKVAAEKLERTPVEDVSGFLIKAISAEAEVMEAITTKTGQYESHLQQFPEIRNLRIIKNHSQIMALVDALAAIIPIGEEHAQEAKEELMLMAVARQQAINTDHPLVLEFWEIYEYLNGDDEPRLNHSRDDNLIAVNLNHFQQLATEKKQQLPDMQSLKRVLKTSRAYKFVDIKTVNSAIRERHNREAAISEAPKATATKCWVFQRP